MKCTLLGVALIGAVCVACSGSPTTGSVPDGAPADHGTPADQSLPDGACTSEMTCASGQYCHAPGDPICGGACAIFHPCTTDTDCQALGSNMICPSANGCPCPTMCTPGCKTMADCSVGTSCAASGHCLSTPCSKSSDCPSQFICNQANVCARQSCTTSASCSGGYCVNALCYTMPGQCLLPQQ